MVTIGFPELMFILIGLLLAVGCFAFWIWILIDCATKEPDTGNTKIVWILIILFAQIIGAIIYYFVRRPQRWREVGR